MLSDKDNQAPRLSGTDKAVDVYMRLELHSAIEPRRGAELESVDSLWALGVRECSSAPKSHFKTKCKLS